MPKIRLLISDVDGTLVNQSKQMTERSIAVVKKLMAQGVRFTVTSGRPPRGMRAIVQTLGMTLPLAGFNGGAYVQADMTPIERIQLDPEAARGALESIGSHKLDVWVYCDQQWYVRDVHGAHVSREQGTVQFAPTVVDSFQTYIQRAVKIVGVSDDYPAVARCETDVQRDFGKVVSALRSQPYYLDVTNPLANKGEVVLKLSKMLGIPTEEIATIGDMPTDVLMFDKSGMSIAMGNASREVKAKATYVTDTNEAEGFAKAVDKYLL